MKRLAVLRVRGSVNCPYYVEETLEMIHLPRTNHCWIIDDRPQYKGMLQLVKDYITWGELSEETLVSMIQKRGRTVGDKHVTDAFIKDNSKFKDVGEFAKAFLKGEAELKDINGLKGVFRLSPPSKGYKSVKRPVKQGGDLGPREKAAMDKLLMRMI